MSKKKAFKAPASLYHVSPWKLKVGATIKPRWSGFALEYKVWMCSSLKGAIDIGKAMLSDFKEGIIGFAGTGYDRDFKGEDLHGIWIYRVKPTGPVERVKKGEWTTSFPLRILELVEKAGEPEKNRLPPSPLRSDEDVGAFETGLNLDEQSVQRIIKAFENSSGLVGFSEKISDLIFDERWIAELHAILSNCTAEKVDTLNQWKRRKIHEAAQKKRKKRRIEHRKLAPDPRYKRDKSWKNSQE